ncbi:MAG: hypothetical protein DI591_00230 [Citromicrobium sp.]|nr:MAG: hypothetical protein DI591_00230 [Citromicrobium sp.]
MEDPRIEGAVARIEHALARIAAIADQPASRPATAPHGMAELVEAHERLREQVAHALAELDDVLAGAEA